MPKYIEVNELKEWVENWFYQHRYYHPYSKSNNIPIPELYDLLETMTDEFAHWETKIHVVMNREIPHYFCSKCGKESLCRYPYCPNCGIKIDLDIDSD